MAKLSFTATPGPTERSVRTPDGVVHTVPEGWVLVPPGDPGLTRRIKAAGPAWTVTEKRGRKTFSRGVWVPAISLATVSAELEAERASPAYAKKRAADAKRREVAQGEYVEDFSAAVVAFLNFATRFAEMSHSLAKAVTEHATPVGSGTVARTKRIPVEERASAAVIAWMRHQTTGYDSMVIPRVKGKRREVRRMLAARSRELLDAYRRGIDPAPTCPLLKALSPV